MDEYCVWGDEIENPWSDCLNGHHTSVICINCGEPSDFCVYDLVKPSRVCEKGE